MFIQLENTRMTLLYESGDTIIFEKILCLFCFNLEAERGENGIYNILCHSKIGKEKNYGKKEKCNCKNVVGNFINNLLR